MIRKPEHETRLPHHLNSYTNIVVPNTYHVQELFLSRALARWPADLPPPIARHRSEPRPTSPEIPMWRMQRSSENER